MNLIKRPFGGRIIAMVSHWSYVEQGKLKSLLEQSVWNFLSLPDNNKILYWLDDSEALLRECKTTKSGSGSNNTYYDYSFMITPAFKALELWIIAIAPFLGVEQDLIEKAKDYGKFNTFLNDESIEKLVRAVSKKLEIQSDKKREMRQSLEALSSYLKNLRHSPAHCGTVISNPDKAGTFFHEIVGGIDRITNLLIEQGVIKS